MSEVSSTVFSRRSGNPAGSPSSLVLAMEEHRRTGRILFDLTCTDPTGWEERADLERKALSLLAGEAGRHYDPQPTGLFSAREALSRRFGGSPDHWILCASTSEAYSLLFQLLANPGERLAVCRPSYPLLDDLARHGGVGLVDVPLHWADSRWQLDIGWVEKHLRDPTVRALVLIQPGNPSGWWLTTMEREKVLSLCRTHGKPLICDEVFSEDLHKKGFLSLHGEDCTLIFVLGGLSKSLGLPQLKLGWIHASGPQNLLENSLERLGRLNDSLLSASTPIQIALDELLGMEKLLRAPIQNRCLRNLDFLSKFSDDVFDVLPSGGGWSRILRLGNLNENKICWDLLSKGVLVQPGFLFDLQGENIVISILSEPSCFSAGLTIIHNMI
jgi:aspartate/methionine/tyrosine aminotransferase